MKTSQKVVAAALTIALGVLLIVLKSGLVNLVLVGLGVMLIVLGILNIVDKLVPLGVTKIVIGAEGYALYRGGFAADLRHSSAVRTDQAQGKMFPND